MDLIDALYRSYNYAESIGLVDNQKEETILLPLFHNSIRSTGKNIVEIVLTNQGRFFEASFVEENQYLIFPVTYFSSTRSGRMPPPHPIFDKAVYLVPSNLEHHKLYREEFLGFKNFLEDGKPLEFMNLIDSFIETTDWFDQALDYLYEEYQRDEFLVVWKDEKKENKIDFSNIYFNFKILNFLDGKDMDISNFTELHKSYVSYVQANLEHDGTCNISGKKDFISRRHRGIFGNARLVSVSNNIETYRGRFSSGDDIFNLGFTTSEKAHLMLRYLIENPNSNQFLGDTQYLINWFSDDIANESGLDLLDPNENYENETIRKVVSKQNEGIGSSFFKGKIQFDKDADFYILLIDKSSAGRVSVKYFKTIPVAELVVNLAKWNDRYNWPTYIEEFGRLVDRVPSFFNIMISTYGVERNGKLVVDNKSFTKDQIQKMITSMIEGEEIQSNISLKLANNIRQRHRYDKTWNQMKRVALSILRNQREKRYDNMLDKENMNRSYLFGRLLAIYELIESSSYANSGDARLTNAEKFWASYLNNPARTQITLERNVQVYLNKLMKDENKIGLGMKFKKAKSEVINQMDELYQEHPEEMSRPLDFDFIFGYEGQKAELFKKPQTEEEENNELR